MKHYCKNKRISKRRKRGGVNSLNITTTNLEKASSLTPPITRQISQSDDINTRRLGKNISESAPVTPSSLEQSRGFQKRLSRANSRTPEQLEFLKSINFGAKSEDEKLLEEIIEMSTKSAINSTDATKELQKTNKILTKEIEDLKKQSKWITEIGKVLFGVVGITQIPPLVGVTFKFITELRTGALAKGNPAIKTLNEKIIELVKKLEEREIQQRRELWEYAMKAFLAGVPATIVLLILLKRI